ncbi:MULTISPECIES: type ISP restriction/modification enzyme [Bacillus]|uniref:Putative helicase n=8 Tax=Bacillaceae TaxID=186817 RepID=A0A164L5U9_BACCE|nr:MULTISPECIES: type ISP restriction/modification enzyme [Bacillus]EEL78721.1 Restriction-modification system LlaBIII [Bacillus cereus AH1271]KXY02199.1 helicase [Bacillus cereus]KXY85422.1 helicase [Bacillus cereus]KZD54812.1 putative helicase [Bacillus cereus]KZD76021.1 putative helicase [Bacillus cereus]
MENKNINTFDDLIEQINEVAGDIQRERGSLFEKLVLAYLKNEPTYQRLYKNIWTLTEVPIEYGIPKKDTGVDLVAEQFNGDLVAIQAKFYKKKIGKDEINSFVAEMGKSYYQRGLIISTVDDWNKNARETIEYNEKGIEIIGLSDLRNSQIDWTKFSFKRPEVITVKSPKKLRGYQEAALGYAMEHFNKYDRGQLIMAPGTGKTFTSLRISEALAKKANKQFKVLYLVPSIQLLTQTLRGWNNDTELNIASMAVTSDRDASRGTNGTEDIKANDIGYPATTSKEQLMKNWKDIEEVQQNADMVVVFSTYQSIDVIGKAQKEGFPEFDLIISDEAHRTTGAYEANKQESVFSKVHSNTNVQGIKRMYQTATPKIYADSAKKNAKDKSILISSMDDESKYGKVFYRMGFGQAVSHGILTEYKVMVLAIDEAAIQKDMQKTLADPENGLNIDDVGRIVGIWNGMMRRNGYKNPVKSSPYSGAPLERAIAFTRTIDDSKKVSQQFEEVVNEYIGDTMDESVHLSMRHADGSMNALQKGEILDWLADPKKPSDEARIVSNVRFLTEGIDVPTLDAIIFLAPKKSQVDIVQAVGRIMRKAEGKDYGYIILPIVIPIDEKPETILDNNKNYEAVWQVINALRSVDERFEAMVDKINIAKPKQLDVIGIGSAPAKENDMENTDTSRTKKDNEGNISIQTELDFEWDKFESAIYGKIVQKVGDRKYLENWSADVAKIAQRQISWIQNKLKDKKDPITIEFKKFVSSLQHNINESIDENQASEMLSQHLITKPVFEALFDEYSFVNNNPVSSAMENIVKELEKAGFAKEQENLEPLYESVKMRAEGVEKSEDKQKIIITLYDKFFSTAFKSTTERLGIVFTPIEVVDFIVKSVDDVLKKHFGKSLASEGVHILDPFTGTGTFIVRTLTYLKEQMDKGEITLADIARKFTQELHANEIVLLSYYIAAINIESTFDEINGDEQGYVPFEGIVLTDTFESTENEDTLDDAYFGTNDERLKRQQELPITAIIGNPPYSGRDSDENSFSDAISYQMLDTEITKTYAKKSSAVAVNALYDSYIRAIKWSSLRIEKCGVIGFITSNSYIDKVAMDGLRKSLNDEFNYIYIINLRGGVRGKTGTLAKEEGGNVFDIMTGVAIILLIKDGSNNHNIYYHDIGKNLNRKQKIDIIQKWEGIMSVTFEQILPDSHNDWIHQRNSNFDKFRSLYEKNAGIYDFRQMGITSKRDKWVYGFSKENLIKNIQTTIKEYENVRNKLKNNFVNEENIVIDETKIQWSRELKRKLKNDICIEFDESKVVEALYRPFTKKHIYYDKNLISYPGKFSNQQKIDNMYIMTPGSGNRREFSVLVTDLIPDGNIFDAGAQTYASNLSDNISIFSNISVEGKKVFDMIEDDVPYYIYAVLNSIDYRNIFNHNLSKETPRIPLLKNKEKYVEIGRKLADLHLNYENQPSWNDVEVVISVPNPNYKVTKMKPLKKGVLDTIIYNEHITIKNIPEKAYEYVVNGRSAIGWIIDQYQIKTDKKSGITDDPNEFSDDPKYILNLLLSVITVSMKTLELVKQLPDFEILEQ